MKRADEHKTRRNLERQPMGGGAEEGKSETAGDEQKGKALTTRCRSHGLDVDGLAFCRTFSKSFLLFAKIIYLGHEAKPEAHTRGKWFMKHRKTRLACSRSTLSRLPAHHRKPRPSHLHIYTCTGGYVSPLLFISLSPSKTKVASAGIGPDPISPYANSEGIVNLLLPPT